jgi:hypothetical protein
VFVCSCGINIAGTVDVKAVTEYARTLPNVVYVENNLFTCAADTQDLISQKIGENDLNRIVIAACTPAPTNRFSRTPERSRTERLPGGDGQHSQPEFLGASESAGKSHRKSQGPGAHGHCQGA